MYEWVITECEFIHTINKYSLVINPICIHSHDIQKSHILLKSSHKASNHPSCPWFFEPTKKNLKYFYQRVKAYYVYKICAIILTMMKVYCMKFRQFKLYGYIIFVNSNREDGCCISSRNSVIIAIIVST